MGSATLDVSPIFHTDRAPLRWKPPMKILHTLSQRPDSTGSGIYLQAMLRQAAKAGHESRLLAGIPAGDRPDPARLPADRITFVEFDGPDISFPIVGMSDVMPYASRRFRDLTEAELDEYETVFAARLREAAEGFAPDAIHSHHLWLLSSLVRRLFPDTPLITSCHGSDLRQFRSCPHLRERVLAGCRDLDAVLVLTEAMKADAVELYGLPAERIHIVGAGYDDSLFRPASKPQPDPVRLVYAGKLSRAKGVPWLLRVLQGIEAEPWELDLVGSGAGREAELCLELAAELGPRVRVHGAVPQPELARILRSAHVFVLPSFFEGLPLVVVEALACGCRAVVTALPGIRELLDGAETDVVALVDLPRLRDQDVPLAEDEPAFEKRLAAALSAGIEAARRCPQPDSRETERVTGARSWSAVYERIDGILRLAAGR